MYNELFSPMKIRGMELKNRIVFPAMGTKMPGDDKFVNDQIIDYHLERVKGGCGLNFLEVCGVHEPSSPNGFLSLGDDKYIDGLKKLTHEVHKEGGKIGVQLWQGGMAVLNYPENTLYVPSDLNIPNSNISQKGMSIEDIDEVVKAYGDAAKRAVEAGFDCVEFHAGHNYLPHAFLSPAMNFRTDKYGGSLENRMRFSLECIRSIRRNIPDDMPISMRIVAHDDYLENGLTIEEIIEFSKEAGKEGVDILNVSRGNFISDAIVYEVPPIDLPRGFNVDNAKRIKEETGMLTIAVGRITTPDQANEIIKEGKSDMVVIGRSQLSDPDFANKARDGREKEILKCIGCNQGCYDGFVSSDVPFITCLLNPAVGREKEFRIEKTDNPKDIIIAGGGMAGLEAGIVLKRRGHNPTIYESEDNTGGQFIIAGEAPRKEELKESVYNLEDIARIEGVEIKTRKKVDYELIKEESPDEVIIAIGAGPLIPNIKGIEKSNVYDAHSTLAGKNDKSIGESVIVIGGGLVGLEAGEYLRDKKKDVTIIEMEEDVGRDLGEIRKIMVMKSLKDEGIKVRTKTKCLEILEDGVLVSVDGKNQKLEADNVIVAIGSKPNDSDDIVKACKEEDISYHHIGDVIEPRRALEAIREARELAIRI